MAPLLKLKMGRNFSKGKPQPGFLAGWLRIERLVLRGVSQLGGGTVGYFDGPPVQTSLVADPAVGHLGGARQGLLQTLFGQALASLNVGRRVLLDAPPALGLEKPLHGAHHLAAGGLGLEHLPDETLKGQAHRIDAIPAARAFLFGGQQMGWKQIPEFLGQGQQIELAQATGGAPTQGGELGAKGGKEGRG